ADKVRDGTTFEALANQLPVTRTVLFGGQFVVAGIQLDAPAANGMGEKHFRIQARKLRAFLGQEARSPVQQTANGPGLFGFRHWSLTKSLLLVVVHQGADQLAEVAGDDGIELVQVEIDAVIRYAVLGKIVSADTLAAVAGADQVAALLGAFAVQGLLLPL